MNTPTPRHATWLAILLVLATALTACTQPSDGGGSGAPAGSDAPDPVPTYSY